MTVKSGEEIVAGNGGHGAGRNASAAHSRSPGSSPFSSQGTGEGLRRASPFAEPGAGGRVPASFPFAGTGQQAVIGSSGQDLQGDGTQNPAALTSPLPFESLHEPYDSSSPSADAPASPAWPDAIRLAAAWARRRSLQPASVCGISMAITLCAAVWYTAGARSDSLWGTAALWAGYLVALTARAVPGAPGGSARGGQRYGSRSGGRSGVSRPGGRSGVSRPGGRSGVSRPGTKATRPAAQAAGEAVQTGTADWLPAVGWWVSECAVYAGLTIGAIADGWANMWVVAIAVIGLIGVREAMNACTPLQAGGSPSRTALAIAVRMPPGGRVLLVGIAAPALGPHAALLALSDWAVIAVIFGIAGHRRTAQPSPSRVLVLRDDGLLARQAGRLVKGNLLPLPPALLGLVAVASLAALGLRNLPGLLVLGPALIMLLAAPGSSNDHEGRFDWLLPVLLLGAQIVYFAALGPAVGVPAPITFALCGALLLRYADLGRPGRPIWLPCAHHPARPSAERGAWLGWEGRMLVAGVAAAAGIATFAYLALAAYLGVLVGAKIVTSSPALMGRTASDRSGPGGRR